MAVLSVFLPTQTNAGRVHFPCLVLCILLLLTRAKSKTDNQKGNSQPFLCNTLLKIRRAAFHTFVVRILLIAIEDDQIGL